MMDNYTRYIVVSSNFKISELCLKTVPCHHYVKLDDKDELWNAKKIYKYCQEQQIKVPEHFIYIDGLV